MSLKIIYYYFQEQRFDKMEDSRKQLQEYIKIYGILTPYKKIYIV